MTSGANAQLALNEADGATVVTNTQTSGGQLQTTSALFDIFGTADTERGRFLSGRTGLTFNGDTASLVNAMDDYGAQWHLEVPDSGYRWQKILQNTGGVLQVVHYVKVGDTAFSSYLVLA